MNLNYDNSDVDTNRALLTGAPGAHPVDTGIGAVVGRLPGNGVAETLDLIRQRADYLNENFRGRDRDGKWSNVVDYGPAYAFGLNARGRYPGRDFDDVQSEMSREWAASRGPSILSWEWAKLAARDAWNRISAAPAPR